jgi:biotin operon repressor
MRSSTVEMMKKVKTLLLENEYISGQDLAAKCNLAPSSIYRIINLMRREGIGVHVTPQGYILSEMAAKKDDTHFLRRLNGRRVSDFHAVKSSGPHIIKRWRGVEDKNHMSLIMSALDANESALTSGFDSIKALEDKYEL